MRRLRILLCLSLAGFASADDPPAPIVFEPVPGAAGELEIGFWEGEGNGLGGHVRIKLKPFKVGELDFADPRLDMNRFQLTLPYDLRSLNDRTIDCDSNEFFFGAGGGLDLDSASRQRIPLTPKTLRFLRTGNEEVQLVMKGNFASEGLTRPFVIEAKLNVGWSYGEPEGQVTERKVDRALEAFGIPDLPRRIDLLFQNGEEWGSAEDGTPHFKCRLLRVEPASRELLATWMERLTPLPDPEPLLIPETPPGFWFYHYVETPESDKPLLTETFPVFGSSQVFDKWKGTIRPYSEAFDGFYAHTFRVVTPITERVLFFKVAEGRQGWIAIFPDEKPNGRIFLFDYVITP